MAANHYIPGAVPASLDDTADYPPLPESFAVPGAPPPPPPATASPHATDTWVMPRLTDEPAPKAAPAPPQPSTDELLRPYREERTQLRSELAAVNRERDELKRQLETQATSIRELERRLQDETGRSAVTRDEFAQLQARSATAASELEARNAELRSSEDKLRGAEDKLRSAEDRERAREAQLRELERRLQEDAEHSAGTRDELAQLQGRSAGVAGELEARAAELHSVEDKLRSAEDRLRSAGAEGAELRASLGKAQAELALLAAEKERLAATQASAESDRARRESAFARSQDELGELHRRLAAHGEVLRRVEGQRHVFDAQLREREAMLDEAHSQLRDAKKSRERVDAELAAAIARAEKAEQRLAKRAEPTLSPPSAPPMTTPEGHAPFISAAPAAPAQAARPAEEAVPDEPAARTAGPALIERVGSLEAELADSRAQLDLLQAKLASAQRAERSLRAELDHHATLAQGTDAGISLPWPAAGGPASTAAPARAASVTDAAPAQELTPLLVRTSGEAGIVHVLGRRTTIGRTPDNDLRIEADYVSRHHCVVLVNPERTIVEDLNSTNGVYVNGARIMRHELREGDVITIGDTSFRYVRKPASAA